MPKIKKLSSQHATHSFGFTAAPYIAQVDVTENDVLLGRGDHSVHHEGNIRFRQVISDYLTQYLQTDDNDEKNKIANIVVRTIVGRSGRFLRKATASDIDKHKIPPGSNSWIPTTDEKGLIRKIKQSFRDLRDSELKKICKAQEAAKGKKDKQQKQAVTSLCAHGNTTTPMFQTSPNTTVEMATAASLLRGRKSDHVPVSDTDRILLMELQLRNTRAVAAAAAMRHRQQQQQQHRLIPSNTAAMTSSSFLLQQQINELSRPLVIPSLLKPSNFTYPNASRLATIAIDTPTIPSIREQALLQRIRLADSLELLSGTSNNKRYKTSPSSL